ncbi:unnamed protein product [Adineta ricciae]|uniref:EGF-like domain-containing protein n=1 Tax=Adineta ricciae TaxID=249248 RepID=A0A814Q163_ADIRI|nr:unnamed protein product [Adineta ricciae]
MLLKVFLLIWLLFTSTINLPSTASQKSSDQSISFNQPKFCLFPSWNPAAITLAGKEIVGASPRGIFIDQNNTIYVAGQEKHEVIVWFNSDTGPSAIKFKHSFNPMSLFVMANGDIYIENGVNNTVRVWSENEESNITLSNVNEACFGLFVDIVKNLYFTVREKHQVIRQSLTAGANVSVVVAGTGQRGASAQMLYWPRGIFVNNKLDLYVADCGNNRVQLFTDGNKTGVTVAGKEAKDTIELYWPTGVLLDANGYLYVVDEGNHRIVGSGPYGFRCLVGCYGAAGSSSFQLNRPESLAFDSHGNMFVTDRENHRVQKFLIQSNSCMPIYNQPKFCPSTSWTENATTLMIGHNGSFAIFVTNNNSIYVTNVVKNWIELWTNEGSMSTILNRGELNQPFSVFVTTNFDIVVDNGKKNRIELWTQSGTYSIQLLQYNDSCFGLFVDVNDNIYCSIQWKHQVIRNSLYKSTVNWTMAAGNGSPGFTSDRLTHPRGIFVDTKLNLYVADSENHRIQCFQRGNKIGQTVLGNETIEETTLNTPSGVIVDFDGYLFVVDSGNARIIGSGPNGFRCLVGCSGKSGSKPNELNGSITISFDSYGNLFVVDRNNARLQKFTLTTNSCHEHSYHTNTTTDIITTSETLLMTNTESSFIFIASPCNDSTYIGPNCSIPNHICNISNPCQNNGTCNINTTNHHGYDCSCQIGFNGTTCEIDRRPCKSYTCLYHGKCNQTSDTTFHCECDDGWQGIHCESMTNYCHNITCSNNGVCRPLLRSYKCECLGSSYSGRHCETASKKIVIFKIVSKSFAYIAVIALGCVAAFVIIMDILRYGFGIDPVREERVQIRRARLAQRRRRRPLIERFVYVNAPRNPIIKIEDTTNS